MASNNNSKSINQNNKAPAVAAAPPLNVYKKVAVIRHPSDSLTYEDSEGNPKSVSIQELGDAIATATPLHTPKLKLDIPVPDIRAVERYDRDVPATYRIPLSYVRYHKRTAQEWNQMLEYVADWEDECWLRKYNYTKLGGGGGGSAAAATSNDDKKKLPSAPRPRLSLHLFEQMMDLLETATAFEAIITTNQADRLFQARLPELYAIFPLHTSTRANKKQQQQQQQQQQQSQSRAQPAVVTSKTVIHDVYNYWVQKRSKLKRPLLRRFWPVTSSDDTNPHLVFRPREKEKYKLRKKRQNDANAYRKLKQLRDEFDTLRCVLQLVQRREELAAQRVRLVIEHFEQRLYECVDTTGIPRESSVLADCDTSVPVHFERGRPPKRVRASITGVSSGGGAAESAAAAASLGQRGAGSAQSGSGSTMVGSSSAINAGAATSVTSAASPAINIAGRNSGEPAPHFLHPLPSRETWAVSYQGTVPHVATYKGDNNASSNNRVVRFRHRPRVGRGGRLCIDRVPLPEPDNPSLQPHTVFVAGKPLPYTTSDAARPARLLELLPKPLDHAALARRIETISVAAIKSDYDAAVQAQADHGTENDGEAVVVPLQDWLETDDHVWGDERYSIGPL